jgi:ferredoxin
MKHEIRVENTNITFLCDENEFILDAMQKGRYGPIHYGCHGGGCGYCKMQITEGEFEIVKNQSRAHVTVEEEKEGYILICCAKPRSSLKLKSIK